MKQLDVISYRKINESFCRRMVCRIGIDCGFFVEMNYMINAMLYCLAHNIRFQLYSDDANFGTGIGWREYFMPFCEEVHESFHKKYNFHNPPSWRRIMKACRKQNSIGPIAWKLKSIHKTIIGHLIALGVYHEYVLFTQDVSAEPDLQYDIPELGIKCGYYEAYGSLARMIWRFQPDMLYQKIRYKDKLNLPSHYDGIHIRGGDKSMETELICGTRIMQVLNPNPGSCEFILTDDYRQFQELRANYPHIQFLTLCQPEERGYLHKAFTQKSPKSKKEAIIRLIISVDFLLNSRSFIGSITTGPSVFIMKQRMDDPFVQAVDCPKADMTSSLSLTIDARAAISKRNMQ